MMRKMREERGALFVEASIVFPVMFVIIFLMLFLGNAYYLQSRIEKIVMTSALDGAAYCADPMLAKAEQGKIPGLKELHVEPYRYLLTGGMRDITDQTAKKIDKEIEALGNGFFPGMKPKVTPAQVSYNEQFIYATFSVDLSGKIRMPIRLLFEKNFLYKQISYHVDLPVSDSTEFVRNVDMVEDVLERYGVMDRIHTIVDKLVKLIPEVKGKES